MKQGRFRFRKTCRVLSQYPNPKLTLPKLELDLEFYLNPENTDAIKDNMRCRNNATDIDEVIKQSKQNPPPDELMKELLDVPNMSNIEVQGLSEPRVMFQRDFIPPVHKIRSFEEICRILGAGRFQSLTHFSGDRTYYLTGLESRTIFNMNTFFLECSLP